MNDEQKEPTRRPLPAPQPGGGGEAEDKPTNVSEEVYRRAQQGLDLAHERISATPPIALPVRAEADEWQPLPCPFCGGNATVFSEALAVMVGCDTCKVHVHRVIPTSEDARFVIAIWNRRQAINSTAALSRELEEGREEVEKWRKAYEDEIEGNRTLALTMGGMKEGERFREFCKRVAEEAEKAPGLRAELAKVERERSALSWTISDMSQSLSKLTYDAKGHVCDYRKVCDSLRDKIKGHQERHELVIQAFASANDRAITQSLRAELEEARRQNGQLASTLRIARECHTRSVEELNITLYATRAELEESRAEAARAKAVNADLKAQRDAACRESERRDQKWMAGIQEECGTEINFDPLTNSKTHVPTLGQFITKLRAELEEGRAKAKSHEELYLNLTDKYIRRQSELASLRAELEEAKAACDVAEENHKAFAKEHCAIATALGMPTHSREQDILDRITALRAAPRSEGLLDWLDSQSVKINGWEYYGKIPKEQRPSKTFREFLVKFAPAEALAPRSETEGRDKERWQGIATAPKDGRPILLAHSQYVTVGYIDFDGQPRCSVIGNFTTAPTHWMPKPPPPALAHDEKGAGE